MSQDQGWGSYYEKLRDRPPRKTVIAALDAFGERKDALALDLGCGDGRDIVEILRRGWKVVAVDSEPGAGATFLVALPRSGPPANGATT